MIKKLLVIALSTFMILGMFANVAYASDKKIADILPSNMPTTEQTAWISRDGNYSIFIDSDSLKVKKGSTQKLLVPMGFNVTFSNDHYECLSFLRFDYTGSLMNVITYTNQEESETIYFDVPLLISDILSTVTNFPTAEYSNDESWATKEYDKFLIVGVGESDYLSAYISGENKEENIMLDIEATSSGNTYIATNGSATFTFNMVDGVLTSVVISDSTNGLNGTYTKRPTIGDMLDKAINFPTTVDDGWISDNGSKIYLKDGILNLYISPMQLDTGLGPISSTLSGVNQFDFAGLGLIDFNIVDDVLVSITFSGITGEEAVINGTYKAPTPAKTIADILDTATDFPEDPSKSWITTEFDKMLVIDTTDCDLTAYIPLEYSESIPLNTKTTLSGDTYTASNGSTTFTFYMTDDVLTSVVISDNASGLNGTYTKRPSVSDMLDKADNFPTTSENGWSNGNGLRLFKLVNGEDESLNLYFESASLDYPIINVSDKLTDLNQIYVGLNENLTFDFNGNKLVSITISGFTDESVILNGTYKYVAPVPSPTPVPKAKPKAKYVAPVTGVN